MDDIKHTKQRITDEELEQFKDFFDEAIARIEKKDPKSTVILDIANRIKNTGYTEQKICSTIIKRLGVINPRTGKKYADDDYIRKILPASMKDYVHGIKAVSKEKDKDKKKTPEELSKERKQAIDKTIKTAIEIGKEKGFDMGTTEIEIPETDDSDADTVIETTATIIPKDTKNVKELESDIDKITKSYQKEVDKNIALEAILNTTNQKLDTLQKDYSELLQKYNWVSKPYMERRWAIVKTPNPNGGEPLITVVESDAVANPVMKRINIPANTKNKNFSREIPFEDLTVHKKEWDELTKGKKYLDVAVKSKTQEQETQE